jgi:uncharacterized protein
MKDENAQPIYPDAEPVYQLLIDENIPALEQAIASGWHIDRHIRLSATSSIPAINIALSRNKPKLLDFLLDRGADIHFTLFNPLIWAIQDGCPLELIDRLIARGARLDAISHVGVGAYQAALYGKHLHLLPELLRRGLPIDADSGRSLRSAAFNRQFEVVRFFVENGHDPNLHVADSVFPNNPTAVAIAARNGDLEMVRYLVEHGADITLKDEYGDRPYSLAREHAEVQQYLKALEPPAWHDDENSIARLKRHKLPPDLIAFLRGDNRRMALEGCIAKWIEFHRPAGLKELKWGRRKVVDLVAAVDNYDETGFLVWSTKDRKLAHADIEHDELTVLCTWGEFLQDPSKWINLRPS